jgi:hypothetical protein
MPIYRLPLLKMDVFHLGLCIARHSQPSRYYAGAILKLLLTTVDIDRVVHLVTTGCAVPKYKW